MKMYVPGIRLVQFHFDVVRFNVKVVLHYQNKHTVEPIILENKGYYFFYKRKELRSKGLLGKRGGQGPETG
jgi:hypothetical protein